MELLNTKDETKRADPPPVVPFQLRLGSIKSCRQTMARLIREHGRGKIDEGLFRSLIWGLSQLISYWKLENELQIEERVKRLEEIAEELEADR